MNYKTKQKEMMLDILKDNATKKSITTANFVKLMKDRGVKISKATIYRQFRFLEEEGIVRVFFGSDGEKHYEYIKKEACKQHLHMICRNCSKISHINCEAGQNFIGHIEEEHGFKIDKHLTMIYGICSECSDELED